MTFFTNLTMAFAETANNNPTGIINIKQETTQCAVSIENSFNNGQLVNPGDKLNDSVIIKNTGNVDAIVRLQVLQNLNGKETALKDNNSQSITLNWDKTNWIYNNGYFYYKYPLKIGESTTNLLHKIEITKNLPKSDEGKQVQINFRANGIQATQNSADLWHVNYKAMGIQLPNTSSPKPAQTIAIFSSKDTFIIKNKFTDLDYNKILPGETVSQIITTQNNSLKNLNIKLQIKTAIKPDLSETDKNTVKDIMQNKLAVAVTDEQGKPIYSGPALNKSVKSLDKTNSVETDIPLTSLSPSDKNKNFLFTASKDSSITNAQNRLIGDSNWYLVGNTDSASSSLNTSNTHNSNSQKVSALNPSIASNDSSQIQGPQQIQPNHSTSLNPSGYSNSSTNRNIIKTGISDNENNSINIPLHILITSVFAGILLAYLLYSKKKETQHD